MGIQQTLIKDLIIGMAGLIWLVSARRIMRLESGKAFHVAVNERDRRKAKFYYQSVWLGLLFALISVMGSEAMTGLPFESAAAREAAFGIMRGLGVWGIVMAGLVWTQVGRRVSELNSDGQSMMPVRENEKH